MPGGLRRGNHQIMMFILFFVVVSVWSGSVPHHVNNGKRGVEDHHSSPTSRQHHLLDHQSYRGPSFGHPQHHPHHHNHRKNHHRRNRIPTGQQRLSSTHHNTNRLKKRRQNERHDSSVSHRHNRNTFGMPLVENLLHRPFDLFSSSNMFQPFGSSSLFRPFHQPHRNQNRLVEKFRNHMDRMQDHLIPERHPKPLSHPFQHQQPLPPPPPHRPSNRYQHHSQHHHPKRNHHLHSVDHRQSLSSNSELAKRGNNHLKHHPNGHQQFKIFKNSLDNNNGIPEDVEVFQVPLNPTPHITPIPPTFRPTIPPIDSHWWDGVYPNRGRPGDVNCTTTLQGPFHHTVFKSTSISHNPVHSLDHHFTSITKGDKNPFHISHSVHSTNRHHARPRVPNHNMNPIPNNKFNRHLDIFKHPIKKVFDSFLSSFERPSQSIIPLIKNRQGTSSPAFEFQNKYFKTNVEDHLNQLNPANHGTKRSQGDREELPCIKCPPDTHVEAPRGTDCVLAYPPSPLSCTPRVMPELRTVVTEGPAPGTLLPEGHYSMVITVLTSDATTSKPITTCKVNYDVEVRKCPDLPDVEGADVSCTAGYAWGSRCSWTCREERILHGASISTCTGHVHPQWSRPPPLCIDPPSKRPTTPRPTLHSSPTGVTCPHPPRIPGGHLVCKLPSEEFSSEEFPSEEFPSKEFPPRRDLIPKDEPFVSRSNHVSQSMVQSQSAALTLASHPVGTMCRVECRSGRILRISESGRATITCTPALAWDKRPPHCHLKVAPKLYPGDCEDVFSIPSPLSSSQLNSLRPPTFFTVNGDPAEVTCNIQEVRPSLHYIRKCNAIDHDLQTSATCQYMITGMTSKPRCPDLAAPENGDLVCHEDDVGDLICKVICNEGFKVPFSVTKCHQNFSRWDFQRQDGEELPSCIPVETYPRPDGMLIPFLHNSTIETPEASENTIGVSPQNPKNPRFKTVADVFEDKVNQEIELNEDDSGRKYEITDIEKQQEKVEESDNIAVEDLINEHSDVFNEEKEDWDDSDFVYYYDALGEDEDPEYFYNGFENIEDEYAYGEQFHSTEGTGDFDIVDASVRQAGVSRNDADVQISDFASQNAYSVDDLEEKNKHDNSFLINSGAVGNGSSEIHFLDLGTIPRMMEEDTSDLFSSSMYPRNNFPHYREDDEVKEEKKREKINEFSLRFEDNLGHLNHSKLNLESSEINREIERGQRTLEKISPKQNETSRDRQNNSWSQYSNTIAKDSIGGSIDLGNARRERGETKVEDEAPVMEAVLKLKMLVEDCEKSNEVEEILTEALMAQDGCKKITCKRPQTTCRNESSNEAVVGVVWVVGGSYQQIEDYYYDDLQVPVVETTIETLVISTERLISSEAITRTLEDLGAAIDLTSLKLTHLDLLCKQPGHDFDPDTNLCGEKKQ